MKLSSRKAQQIVSEITKILPMKLNIMDPDGTIIASSDPSRMGKQHQGAKKMIEEQLGELVIYSDKEEEGVKKGANFSIIVQREIVAILGITGEYETILPYAQIIKKMTEILIMEDIYKQEKEQKETLLNRFLYDWLHSDGNASTHRHLLERAHLLGIDIASARRIIAISLDDISSNDHKILNEAEHKLQRLIMRLNHDSMILKMTTNIVAIINDRDDQKIIRLFEEIEMLLKQEYDVKLNIGVASSTDIKNINQAYIEADKAWKACVRDKNQSLYFYTDIHMELFIEEISNDVKYIFIQKIFKGYAENELKEAIALLEVYYEQEGSITKTSEQLYLHKNTLQNRIKKIARRTGYDPRSIKDSSLFFNAIYFYNDLFD